MKKFLIFSFPLKENAMSVAILIFRVCIALMILTHGWTKLINFGTLSQTFPDPIGLGSTLSLILAIAAEFVATIFVAFGFLTRLSLIVIVFRMCVAFFVAHAASQFNVKEAVLVYIIVLIVLFLIGPGKYSLDNVLFSKFDKKS